LWLSNFTLGEDKVIVLIRNQATSEQITEMSKAFGETLIKLAVDVEREILAGGGELHADCESALLEDGSQQHNVWGADWYPLDREVGFESLINIRPRQQNLTLEIMDPALRSQVETIVRQLLETD
jgi:imidazole glycerol phosphate synthase subunit HisF